MGLVVGSLAGITGSVFDLIGKEAKTDSDEVVAVALGVALMLIFLLMIVNLFRRHKGKGFWFRYWSNSFFFVMAFFVGVLVGTFFIWGGVLIMLAVLIYYGVGLHDVGRMFGGAGSGADGGIALPINRARCCETCACLDKAGFCSRKVRKIGDPVLASCDEYMPRT